MLYQESQIVIHFFLSQTVASCLRGAVRKKGGSSQACLSELLLIPLSWTTKRNLQAAVSAAGWAPGISQQKLIFHQKQTYMAIISGH
jgi:hypothetical protein